MTNEEAIEKVRTGPTVEPETVRDSLENNDGARYYALMADQSAIVRLNVIEDTYRTDLARPYWRGADAVPIGRA